MVNNCEPFLQLTKELYSYTAPAFGAQRDYSVSEIKMVVSAPVLRTVATKGLQLSSIRQHACPRF